MLPRHKLYTIHPEKRTPSHCVTAALATKRWAWLVRLLNAWQSRAGLDFIESLCVRHATDDPVSRRLSIEYPSAQSEELHYWLTDWLREMCCWLHSQIGGTKTNQPAIQRGSQQCNLRDLNGNKSHTGRPTHRPKNCTPSESQIRMVTKTNRKMGWKLAIRSFPFDGDLAERWQYIGGCNSQRQTVVAVHLSRLSAQVVVVGLKSSIPIHNDMMNKEEEVGEVVVAVFLWWHSHHFSCCSVRSSWSSQEDRRIQCQRLFSNICQYLVIDSACFAVWWWSTSSGCVISWFRRKRHCILVSQPAD